MTRRQRALVATLAAILVMLACLALASLSGLRLFVREAILVPLASLFWLAGVLLRSVHESYLWLAGLAIFFVILVNGLVQALRTNEVRREGSGQIDDAQGKIPGGRVRFWQSRVNMLSGHGVAGDYARTDFRRLAQNIDELEDERASDQTKPGEGLFDQPRAVDQVNRLLDFPIEKRRWLFARRQAADPLSRRRRLQELTISLEMLANPGQEIISHKNTTSTLPRDPS